MNGKIVAIFFAITALAGGVGAYALNVYAFYARVPADSVSLSLVPVGAAQPQPLQVSALEAIDATSSPLRFRACFTVADAPALIAASAPHPDPVPLTGPNWFDCYDAQAIGAALESGAATGLLSQTEVRPGVDRVVALFPDGRGFAWHQLNETFDE